MILNKAILMLTVALLLAATPAVAEKATITDVTGRQVELELPAKRVLIGEARQIHVIAALKGEHLFDTIVGWRDDMIKKDPDSYEAYRERFPALESLPQTGYIPSGTFSLEAAIALNPDVLTLNLEAQKSAQESGIEEKAAAAGIAIVYLDFRVDPAKNSEKSIELLGSIFGEKAKAEEFIAYRRAQIALVTERLAKAGNVVRPKVFIERSLESPATMSAAEPSGRPISVKW